MAKKTKKINTVEEQQEKISAEPKNSAEAIHYKGTIKVQIKKGNRVISERQYHNLGNSPLFDFLSKSIIGDSNAQNYAPRYVQIFYHSHESGEKPSATQGIDDGSTLVTPAIPANTSTVVQVETSTTGTSYPGAYLHFIIPCANFSFTEDNNKINQAALYGSKYTGSGNKKNYSAAFNFVNDAGEWDDLTITTANGDYNVFIEWTLSFSN